MSDIVKRLRAVWQNPFATDADPRAMLLLAADEIERLRSRLRIQDAAIRSGDVATLTDAEREAIERACRLIAATMPYESQQGAEDYQALRGLLERLG